MQWMKRRVVVGFLMALLVIGLSVMASSQVALAEHSGYGAHESGDGFNDKYIFATTRGVNDMSMAPALKVTLFPVTIVLDTAFLPFAVIAGFVA